MREIKFRGKDMESYKWVYGNLCNACGDEHGALCVDCFVVDPATVGQYTGLKDKNGVEVYEGDILSRNNAQFPMRGPVKYENGSFFFHDEELGFCWYPLHGIAKQGTGTLNDLEVIGNIHDTKEAV